MKRILTFILALTMLISPQYFVNAQENIEIIVNETFNDAPTNGLPSSVTTTGTGSVMYVKELERGKALYLRNRWSDTSARVKAVLSEDALKFGGAGAASKDIVWADTSILLPDFNTDRNVIEIVGTQSMVQKAVPLLTVDKGGNVRDKDGTILDRVTKNEWHRYTVKINLTIGKYDIYVDGILRAELVNIGELPTVEAMGFTAKANVDKESEIYSKYFRVYKAGKLPREDDFQEAPYNHEVVKLLKRNSIVRESGTASTMYYNDDFQDISENGRPSEFSLLGGQAAVKTDDTGNFYRIQWDAGSGFTTVIICADIAMENLPENVIFQADVRSGRNTGDAQLFNFRDGKANGNNDSQLLVVERDGSLAAWNGERLGNANCKYNWVTVHITSDFKTKTHDYYVNGELVIDDLPFQNKTIIQTMAYIGFRHDELDGFGTLDIDNIKMYSGSELLKDGEEAQDAIIAAPEIEEVWEHEISQTPLNMDMTGYVATPVHVSDSPSNYLADFSEGTTKFNGTIGVVANGPNIWIKDTKYKLPYSVITWDDNQRFLAPIDFLASLSKETSTYSNGTISIGSDFTAKIGEKAITVGGTQYETAATVQLINGKAYVPLKEYVTYKLKKYCSESVFGFAVIADEKIDLKLQANEKPIVRMLGYLALDLPNKEVIKQTFDANGLVGVHPRIFGTQDDINKVVELGKTDKVLKEYLAKMRAGGDYSLNAAWFYNLTSGVGTFQNIESLYFAWVQSGDDKYAEKAEELALMIANLEDWDETDYFLATSANMLICAEMYDLFYDYLSDETKDKLAKAIVEKGLKAAQKGYLGQLSNWPLRRTNWNTVCNTGSMVAAMTLLGEGYDDNLCLDIIEKGLVSLSDAMYVYSGGSVFESVGYHNYGASYVAKTSFVLENVLGTTFGLTNYTGFLDSGYYVYYARGDKNTWALHDDTLGSMEDNGAASYFAYKTKDMTLQKMRHDQLSTFATTAMDIMCYMPGEMPEKIDIPLDRDFPYTEIATSRSHWGQGNFLLGVHGGNNDFEHGQLDSGNFIYEAFGERFATDIGRDDYNLVTYQIEGLPGLVYYAKRAEGHNLYVVNPDENPDQVYRANTVIDIQEKKSRGVIYTVDMTEPYFDRLKEAKRGYMLTNDRSVLVVQDEIVPLEVEDEYRWCWQTEADIVVNDDNSVTLTMNKKIVTLYFDANLEFDIEAGEAGPFSTSPNPPGQLKIGNKFNRIVVTFYAEEDVMDKIYFRCTAVPYGHDDYEIGEIKPISEWTIPDGDIEKDTVNATSIMLDGKKMKVFEPDVYDYTEFYVKHKGLPTVTATAPAGCEVIVRQPEEKYKTAVVTVISPKGMKRTYTIALQSDIGIGIPDGEEIVPKLVVAEDHDGNEPMNLVDYDYNTRWTGKTLDAGWAQFDLGKVTEIDTVALAVLEGNSRAAKFDIQVSVDGKEYTTVIKDGMTSGTSTGMEYLQFEPVEARYVKLVGYGATTSRYNSYTEFHVFKSH